jgi:predicted AAA+ superfamily ATPase
VCIYRVCSEQIIAWANRQERKPLILRGARQVGKTTLVRMMADELKLTLVEINLEQVHSFVPMLSDKSAAIDILEVILLEKGVQEQDPEKLLFFFDEAQELPELIPYLRYFYEVAPEYKIIIAGSLLEFVLTSRRFSFPVGRVEYAYLHPLTFNEFLQAVNQAAYKKLTTLNFLKPVSESLHIIFTKHFKDYLLCGGMPGVVKEFLASSSLTRIDQIKSDILESYISDLPKYSKYEEHKVDAELLEILLLKIASSPTKNETYTKLAPGYRTEVIQLHLKLLEKALLVHRCIHTSAISAPLSSQANPKIFKLMFLDVGLALTHMGVSVPDIKCSSELNDVARGMLVEQAIGQNLLSNKVSYKKNQLYYWERQAKSSTAEVDYIFDNKFGVFPLECKSGSSKKMKALDLLMQEKKLKIAVRLYSGNICLEQIVATISGKGTAEYKLLSAPHYTVNHVVDLEIK